MPKKKNEPLRVVELFAGVGGFRLGLEGYEGKSSSSKYTKNMESNFKVIWSNQYEPLTVTRQHANYVYKNKWEEGEHTEEDIAELINEVPEHDVLVGGFPCQDYSVATTLKNSKGLKGKKGVLWWSINDILTAQKNKPDYLILENVNRLLGSPASQRGRDFAVMLSCLNNLGYAVEWRVINAAEYGMPQRRRRVFILGYKKGSSIYKKIKNEKDWLTKTGVLASAFEVKEDNLKIDVIDISGDTQEISDNFGLQDGRPRKISQFKNTGFMKDGKVFTISTVPTKYSKAKLITFLDSEELIDKEFKDFIIDPDKKLSKVISVKKIISENPIKTKTEKIETEGQLWNYLKGSKKILRKTLNRDKDSDKEFHEYKYAEGRMIYPDDINEPSRTIITGEGGSSPSRFKHVIIRNGRLRRLTPRELERLNMFPVDHTKYEGVTNVKRSFFMGNALVVGVVEKIGISLSKKHKGKVYG